MVPILDIIDLYLPAEHDICYKGKYRCPGNCHCTSFADFDLEHLLNIKIHTEQQKQNAREIKLNLINLQKEKLWNTKKK